MLSVWFLIYLHTFLTICFLFVFLSYTFYYVVAKRPFISCYLCPQVVVLLLLCCSPSCVLAQDINFTTTVGPTTDMGEYTFFADGTTQSPQPSPALPSTLPSPVRPTKLNRTSFGILFENLKGQLGLDNNSDAYSECIVRQAAEERALEFNLPNGGGKLSIFFMIPLATSTENKYIILLINS